MALQLYPFGPGSYDTDQLGREIVAAGLRAPAYVNGSGYATIGGPATSVEVAYDPPLTQAEKTVLDAVAVAHKPAGPRKSRTVLAIYTDLAALTATQKQRVGDDLFAGNPMKILTDAGPNAAAIVALYWGATKAGVSAAAVLDAKLWAAAMWGQDHPAEFVHPSYDPTILVYGDQPA